MGNFFDQFDAPGATPAPATTPTPAAAPEAKPANFFDQFDKPVSPWQSHGDNFKAGLSESLGALMQVPGLLGQLPVIGPLIKRAGLGGQQVGAAADQGLQVTGVDDLGNPISYSDSSGKAATPDLTGVTPNYDVKTDDPKPASLELSKMTGGWLPEDPSLVPEAQPYDGLFRFGGNAAGQIGATIATAPFLGAAMPELLAARTLPMMAARGALAGGTQGALFTPGDLSDRAKGAAIGATAGAILDPAIGSLTSLYKWAAPEWLGGAPGKMSAIDGVPLNPASPKATYSASNVQAAGEKLRSLFDGDPAGLPPEINPQVPAGSTARVPGYEPTMAQLAPDNQAVVQQERLARTSNAPGFLDRADEQNTALRQANDRLTPRGTSSDSLIDQLQNAYYQPLTDAQSALASADNRVSAQEARARRLQRTADPNDPASVARANEAQRRYENALDAHQEAQDAVAEANAAIEDAPSHINAILENGDVQGSLKEVFQGKGGYAGDVSAQLMQDLVDHAGDNPDAKAGLIRGIGDYIDNNFLSKPISSTGSNVSDATRATNFASFLDTHRDALLAAMPKESYQTLQTISQHMLDQTNVPSSLRLPLTDKADNGAPSLLHKLKEGGVGSGLTFLAADRGIDLLIDHVLPMLHGGVIAGGLATGAAIGARALSKTMSAANIRSQGDLLNLAMLYPTTVGRALISKVGDSPANQYRTLNNAILAVTKGSAAGAVASRNASDTPIDNPQPTN